MRAKSEFYIEQPDGSEHQFLLTDPRHTTNPRNPSTINSGQDKAKVARYQTGEVVIQSFRVRRKT